MKKLILSLIIIYFSFGFVANIQASLTQADHDTLLVHFQIISQKGWIQSSVNACNQIIGNSAYSWQDWDEFFWEYYHTHMGNKKLWDYISYPMYWWFGDDIHLNLQLGQLRSFSAISDSLLATHRDTLGLFLANNSDVREALFVYLRGISSLVNSPKSVISTSSRNQLINLITSWIDIAYPDYFKKYIILVPNQYPYVALIRYQLHGILVESCPLTETRIDSLITLLGINGMYESLLRDHRLFIADNNCMSSQDLNYIYNFMSSIPDTLTNLLFMSNFDYYYNSGQPREMIKLYSGSANTFSTIGGYKENQFPPDVTPLYIDGFSVVVAHEVNHRIDPDYISKIPKLQNRREQLLSQAAFDDLQYLRSMVGASFFQTYPQEFVASIANQWFSSSEHSLQLGLVRFDNGYHEPINQVLYFCELYSVNTDTTIFYSVDCQGNIERFFAPIERDDNGNINKLSFQTIVLSFRAYFSYLLSLPWAEKTFSHSF